LLKYQISSLKWKLEQERKVVKSEAYELERRLEGCRQELLTAKAIISVKDSEFDALQNNLKELEELREMKEVLILIFHYFNCFNCIVAK